MKSVYKNKISKTGGQIVMAGQKPLSINEDKDIRKVKRNVEKLFNDFLCYGVNRKVLSSLNKMNEDLLTKCKYVEIK